MRPARQALTRWSNRSSAQTARRSLWAACLESIGRHGYWHRRWAERGLYRPGSDTGTVDQTPLGRLDQPEHGAAVVVFLASDDARWITGETLLTGDGLR